MKRFLLLIILASACYLPCLAQTNRTATQLSAAQIESQVLELLNAGKQSEAEEILDLYAPLNRTNQRVVFLLASCLRSRFMVRDSAPVFAAVADMGTNSVTGQCALHMLYLDVRKDADQHFADLRSLVEKNPNDAILRWMIAVQCRSYDKNEEGVTHYKKLLEQWNPGPVLVHQTYGNLLDELDRYEEALVERRKAIALEPAGWSYQGLGNTLAAMDRFTEANEAFAKSVELSPDDSPYWTSWAWGLTREKKYPEAISKCEKAVALNPKNGRAWSQWGRCLELQGKLPDALEKYRTAMQLNHADEYTMGRITEVLKQISSKPVNAGGNGTIKTNRP